ncbi:MAG: 2-hydroxyacyl-CoA dehydratase family protein [Ignavibacteriae bacterium]|nr:2-hydroxyacyl-CoA dehydratase family protein [Ignavibacteriota bacterium]
MESIKSSDVFKKFSGIATSLKNSEIENWKKQGGKVIGYFCPVIPEEVFIAGGILPFRMRGTGSTTTDSADVYLKPVNCGFPRHTFNQALIGEYDFLDGLVVNTCCDTIMRLAVDWEHAGIKTPFIYSLDNAHAGGEAMVGHFRNQLQKMKDAVEKYFNVEITEQKLQDAIKLCNETKLLQQKLYELRKLPNPPITGSETVAVMVAGSSMPKEQYNKDLKTLLDELGNVNTDKKYSARLMIIGCGHDDTLLCDIIEELGAVVVTDQTCFGSRVMIKTISEEGDDPLMSIAGYLVLDVPYCPKTIGTHPERKQFTMGLAKDYKVDGAVGQCFISCDPWAAELYLLKSEFQEAGIPFIWFEREYIPDLIGQLKTRVEAFIETINN